MKVHQNGSYVTASFPFKCIDLELQMLVSSEVTSLHRADSHGANLPDSFVQNSNIS